MCEFFLDVIVPVMLIADLAIGAMFLVDEVQHRRKGMRRW